MWYIFPQIEGLGQKLRSSATLFAAVSDDRVFEQVLQKFFDGEHDEETLLRLRKHAVPDRTIS